MGKKSHNRRTGVVYSTDPEFEYRYGEEERETLPKAEQRLRVQMEKKGRAGKTVTIVRGFEGSDQDLKELAKMLKSSCGTGGSAKEGEIVLQGDLKDQVIDILRSKGYGDVK